MVKLPLVGRVMSLVRKAPAKRASVPREERMRHVFDHAPIGIAFTAPDGHWLQVNDRFRQIVGYSREELSRITFHSITHPEDARREAAHLRKLIAGEEESFRLEKRTIDKRGRYRTVDIHVSLARNADGGADFFVYLVEEVKDTKPAHREVSSNILDDLDDVAIIHTDPRGHIAGWNRGAQKIFGYERCEVIGKHRRVLYRDADSFNGSPTNQLSSAASGRLEIEDWRVTKDGRQLWVRTALTPLGSDDGEPQGYVEVVTAPQGVASIDTKALIEEMRAELEKRRRTEEALRDALTDLRVTAEETMKELKIMTSALRSEIERRKAVEIQLRDANERLAAIPPPAEETPEDIVVASEVPLHEWSEIDGSPLDLVRRIAAEHNSGALVVTSGDRQIQLFFENGRIFSCASNDPELFLAKRLVDAGVIDSESRRRALDIQQETQLALGRILLILGAITEEQLVLAMRQKVEAEIAHLQTWTDARWTFVGGEVPSLKLVPLRLSVEEVLRPRPTLFASPKTKKVHLETCIGIRRVARESRIEFASLHDAVARGFEQCRICMRRGVASVETAARG